MPTPRKGEKEKAFVARFMNSQEAKQSFPNPKQRVAVAFNTYRARKK